MATPEPDGERARLLVLDDEPLVCELFLDMARTMGFETRCASGASDIAAAAAGSYDAAVVDLHLGDVDVLDALSRLAAGSPGCDVVLITGSAVSSTSAAAGWARTLGLHVVAELHKPVRIAELRTLLAGLTTGAPAAS